MRIKTEDLLKIRDGELLDAAVQIEVDRNSQLRAEVAALQQTQDELRALPLLDPPHGAWEKIADASFGDSFSVSKWEWLFRGAIAATVAAAAIFYVMRLPETPDYAILAADPFAEVGDKTQYVQELVAPTYASLVSQSNELERQLNEIGYRPSLVNTGTTATIVSLEDEIAQVDAQLMYAHPLQPMHAEALWQTRIELMNALLNVRYTQAQLSGF
ncbi:MAG: hypothetical protein CMM56_09250 [Rhodospirillaceae bacterium]|nr:hypothetical protein [Rhodospirillaceae bacterium]